MKIICRKDGFTFPFARITGIRFQGYVSAPKVIGTPLKFCFNYCKGIRIMENQKPNKAFIEIFKVDYGV